MVGPAQRFATCFCDRGLGARRGERSRSLEGARTHAGPGPAFALFDNFGNLLRNILHPLPKSQRIPLPPMTDPRSDILRELGELAFATRLRRLSERLMRGAASLYRDVGLDFEPRWYALLRLLGDRGPTSVTGASAALGFTHPAVVKLAREMTRHGLISSAPSRTDRRSRLLRITRQGRDFSQRLVPILEDLRAVMQGLFAEAELDPLATLDRLEERLGERELYPRLRERLRPRMLEAIEVLDYRPALKQHFRELIESWLGAKLKIEDADRALLADPNGLIVKTGGAVLFARLEGRIVGTCALHAHRPELFELSKMAVAEDARRRLVGTRLTVAVAERARELGARELYLETHPTFTAAQRLYEGLGFERIAESPIPAAYKRRRVVMRLDLSKPMEGDSR